MSGLPKVHQLLPHLHEGDAAGHHALQVQAMLRAAGYDSELFVEAADEKYDTHHYTELPGFCETGNTALIYQLAIGSKVADMLLSRPEPLIINSHNLTPASFFWQWDPGLVDGIVWGNVQLHQLVQRSVHAIGVSAYNTADLDAAGYPSTGVAPPLIDMSIFDGVADPKQLERYRSRKGSQWLFVGRLAPNKAAHHLILALAAYRRGFDPGARLVLIGGHGHPIYTDAITRLIEELGLGDAVELAGSVDRGTLAAAYEASDVFVCLSDHEGFCFPLLEAMHHRLPIVAYAESAVPETVGYGGLLLDEKSPTTVAAAVHRVLAVEGRAKLLADAGTLRLADFDLELTARQMLAEVRKGLVTAELLDVRDISAVSGPGTL